VTGWVRLQDAQREAAALESKMDDLSTSNAVLKVAEDDNRRRVEELARLLEESGVACRAAEQGCEEEQSKRKAVEARLKALQDEAAASAAAVADGQRRIKELTREVADVSAAAQQSHLAMRERCAHFAVFFRWCLADSVVSSGTQARICNCSGSSRNSDLGFTIETHCVTPRTLPQYERQDSKALGDCRGVKQSSVAYVKRVRLRHMLNRRSIRDFQTARPRRRP
jgi:hypothetical protein